MKRLAYVLILVLLAGGAWSALDNFRTKHPVSGREIAVPGQNGPNALLVSGWKTTPAGRQLPSGDMILSGQVSPDGKLFAFTNTGYTSHAKKAGRTRAAAIRSLARTRPRSLRSASRPTESFSTPSTTPTTISIFSKLTAAAPWLA